LLTFAEGLKYEISEENLPNFAGNASRLYESLVMEGMYRNGMAICLALDVNGTWTFVDTVINMRIPCKAGILSSC
jgi:hypothetical protein